MRPTELQKFLNRLIEADLRMSLMIWGPAGVGKSSIVRVVAEQHGLEWVDLRLSQLAPTDLRGLPVPVDGASTWLAPDFLPRQGKGVLFLDEINMAAPAVQGVAQQLVLDRKVGAYHLPDGWFVWAAGNRKEDRAGVFDMPGPLANRFIHLEVAPNLDDFRFYALARGFDPILIAFLCFRPQLLHQSHAGQLAWPSPRTWEMANQLLAAKLSIAPAVGEGPAAEFAAYRELVSGIPDLESVLKGAADIEFPSEPSLRYAVVVGLVSRCLNANSAFNALRWLTQCAASEWVQLFAADLFPLLRQRGHLAAFHKKAMGDAAVRAFATEFTALLLD